MSKQANPVVIGGFVLGALALLVIAILVFSSGALFQKKEYLVSYFPGTVTGLSVGARVEFQGVQVGQVTSIALEYHAGEERFSVPVYYEIWANAAKIIDGEIDEPAEAYRMLVEEKGLRAKLESVSLVTGQYMIALSLQPDTPIRRVSNQTDVIEIPAVAADRDRLANMLEDIDLNQLVNSATLAMDAIRDLAGSEDTRALITHADQALVEARDLIATVGDGVEPLFERVDGTVADYSDLAKSLEATSAELRRVMGNVDRQVVGVSQSAVAAFDQAGATFRSADDLVAEGSEPRYNLELLLQETAGAARSLRILADYLQQNPDALIKGKY